MQRAEPGFTPAASLTEQIADHIADDIIRGRMAPQERIRELRVARSLGVSRGSVREALLLLERRHLIEIVPRRGAVVADLSRRQLDDLYEILETLYGRIARRMAEIWDEDDLPLFAGHVDTLAAAAADDDLDRFAEASDALVLEALALLRNQYLETVIDALLPVSRRALYKVRELDPSALSTAAENWRGVLQAMAEGDTAAVDAALATLFGSYREALTRALCH